MSLQITETARRYSWMRFLAGGIAGMVAVYAARSSPVIVLALVAAVCGLFFALASIRQPLFFVLIFLIVLEVLPPVFLHRFGETPIYISFFLLPVGLAVILLRLPDFTLTFDSVGKGIVLFLAATAFSLPFAWWLSGSDVGKESLFRWLLLAQMALVYFLIRAGAHAEETPIERWIIRLLLIGAVISAAYGIVDFIWPVPLPHPAAAQFIWLRTAILRRAQGVFYESSNFANFCGFFLVIAAVAFLAHKERYLGVPRAVLAFFVAVLSLAVLAAFSRSTWAAVSTSMLTFILISGQVKVRRGLVFLAAMGLPLILLWKYSPELWSYFLNARLGDLSDLFADPNSVSSGRFDTWLEVISIIRENPRYLLFGVGYKTLPITRLFHSEIITDNGYLNLLLETGIVGFAGFLAFAGLTLRTFLRHAHARSEALAFWSAALFSFWCGECVQLMAVDAYTFWRNMAVFAAFMALTLNKAEREDRALRLERELTPSPSSSGGAPS